MLVSAPSYCISNLSFGTFSLSNYSSSVFGVQDKESVGNLVKLIDKSNGYIFAGIEGSVVEFSKIAAAPLDWDYYRYPSPLSCYIYIEMITFNQSHVSLHASSCVELEMITLNQSHVSLHASPFVGPTLD